MLSDRTHGMENSMQLGIYTFGQVTPDARTGRERGWPPMTREQFEASRTLEGASFVGSTDEVIAKILSQHEIFDHDRFLIQFTIGSIPHEQVLRSTELFGNVVAPAVRDALASEA